MGIVAASFPTAAWDGLTDFRPSRMNNRAPDDKDWDEMVAEVIAIETALYPSQADSVIWVAPHGVAATATGSITNPYATLAAAYAAVAADDTVICLMPGTHTVAAEIEIDGTYTGLKIIGVGGSSVTILNVTATADQAISITPAIATAFAITIEGIDVQQYAAKIGILIDDTGQTVNNITVNLKDVKLTMDSSGDSLDVVHAVDIGLILNIENCVFTGLTDLDVASTSDVFTFNGGTLQTIATSATDKAMAINLFYVVLTAISGGHSSQVVSALHCTADDLTMFVSADTGSQTSTACLPLS